jgi:hypothetical protein
VRLSSNGCSRHKCGLGSASSFSLKNISRQAPFRTPSLHFVQALLQLAMIIRSVLRCPAARRSYIPRTRKVPVAVRHFSSSSPIPSTVTTATSPASMLGAFTNELDRIAPKFEIHGSQIRILQEPKEFFETLKVGGIYTWDIGRICADALDMA